MSENEELAFFRKYFHARFRGELTPFAWQEELFGRFVRGEIPARIDLPTGTGKTTVMLVWYLAFAWQMTRNRPDRLPRRLVWVVNRRVVVDQATVEAEAIRTLHHQDHSLPDLAISTLRGEMEDNGEWKFDPTRPAIIIGTVDMTGSRLLFSGYGDGESRRAMHAGLLGVDALFVNDEAHLTPAFSRLLRRIEQSKPAAKIPGMAFRFCEVSATHTAGSKTTRFPDDLEADLASNEEFKRRFTANKSLLLHREADAKRLEAKILAIASETVAPRTIVFTEKPEDALKLLLKLKSAYHDRIELLTGTMRGYERDQLAESVVFQALKAKDPPREPVCLVATSAGEVGVDITSERLITTMAAADHLIQRFGRLNRFGGPVGQAHVVFTTPKEKDTEFASTLAWLEALPDLEGGKDIRACSMRENSPPREAFTLLPLFAELQDWLIELWCQTSGKVRMYPPVANWLHGKQKEDGPQTAIAWRWDVALLAEDFITDRERESVLRRFPVLAHERLTEPTSRLKEKFEAMGAPGNVPVLVRYRDGSVEILTIANLSWGELDEALVLLPPGIGTLQNGMLRGEVSEVDDLIDVAEQLGEGRQKRKRRRSPAELPPDYREVARIELPDGDDEEQAEPKFLAYDVEKPKALKNPDPYLLDRHNLEVSIQARAFARVLVPELEEAFAIAGRWHDSGKEREIWQLAMGRCAGEIVAKSFLSPRGKQLGGFRHELASLVKLTDQELPSEHKELILHMVAAHHGRARPFFGDKAQDTKALRLSDTIMEETPARFGSLVDRWGPWGLAYLEAILKAADAMVSHNFDTLSETEDG